MPVTAARFVVAGEGRGCHLTGLRRGEGQRVAPGAVVRRNRPGQSAQPFGICRDVCLHLAVLRVGRVSGRCVSRRGQRAPLCRFPQPASRCARPGVATDLFPAAGAAGAGFADAAVPGARWKTSWPPRVRPVCGPLSVAARKGPRTGEIGCSRRHVFGPRVVVRAHRLLQTVRPGWCGTVVGLFG